MMAWSVNAYIVDRFYGESVNYEERFYVCPDCGEPIYECDWSEQEFKNFICPICEFVDEDEEV